MANMLAGDCKKEFSHFKHNLISFRSVFLFYVRIFTGKQDKNTEDEQQFLQ